MEFVKASSDDDIKDFNTKINYNMYSEESYYYEFYTIKKYGLGYKGDGLSQQNQEQLSLEHKMFNKARILAHSEAYFLFNEEYKWQTGDPIYIELKRILDEVNENFQTNISPEEFRIILKKGGISSTEEFIEIINGPTEDNEVKRITNLETTELTYPKISDDTLSNCDVLMSKLNIEVEKPYKIMKI